MMARRRAEHGTFCNLTVAAIALFPKIISICENVALGSTDRFLTTHTGSLPRPDDLIRMMFAREEGVPVDAGALDARVRDAIGEMVRKQTEAGVDIINDGEMSKPSYATYVKDRLNGFGGTSNSFVFQDLVGFPKSQ